MDNNMRNLNVILENKTAVIQNIWAERQKSLKDKQKELDAKIDQVLDMAREVGAIEKDNARWIGVLKITQCERTMAVFMRSALEGRLAIIDYYAGVGN
jgi:hypothetical protein